MKTTVQQTFEQLGHTVEVSDLYEIKFNPVASADDFSDFDETEYLNYALEQRNALKSNTLSPDIAVEIEKVKRADLVIFTFPLYWTSALLHKPFKG